MKRWKTFTSLLLAVVLALSCTACMTQLPEEPEQDPMGRYVETSLGGVQGNFPYAISIVDGNLRMLTSTGLYESRYNGAAWTTIPGDSPTLKTAREEWTITGGCFAPDGTMLVCQTEWGEPNEEGQSLAEGYSYIEIDKDGYETTIDITLPGQDFPPQGSNAIDTWTLGPSQMKFGPDGSIFILDNRGNLHRFSRTTGKLLYSVPCDAQTGYQSFAIVGDTLVTINMSGAFLFDCNSCERLDSDQALDQFITGRDENGEIISNYNEYGPNTLGRSGGYLFSTEEEDYLYITGQNGVFRHLLGGSLIEQVISGDLCSLQNPDCNVTQMIKSEDDVFYAACSFMGGGQGPGVLQYTYDPDLPFYPETKLKIYALWESQNIRQAISDYQLAHPDVYISYQIGADYASGVTDSDAVRILNADIMAGNGPDILILDNMPIDAYIEKGLLMDLSDLKAELMEENDLFPNIMDTYTRDGKTCVLPTYFEIPLLYAPQEVVDHANSLPSLVDELVRLREENPAPEQDYITGDFIAGAMLSTLYPVCAPAWTKPDGSLDRELLSEFLQEAKRAYESENKGRDTDNEVYIMNAMGGSQLGATILGGKTMVSLESLSCANGMGMLMAANQQVEGYGYKLLPGQAENVYIPQDPVAINAGTEYPEVAKDFLKTLFAPSQQNTDFYVSLPVNRAVLEDQLKDTGNRGIGPITVTDSDFNHIEVVDHVIRLVTVPPEEIDRLFRMIDALDTPASYGDEIWQQIVNEYGRDYLEGTAALEDTLESIMSQVNLYLAEQQ